MTGQSKGKGFTLIEVVIVVALTAMLMVAVFGALAQVRENEARMERSKDEEKDVYLLFHRLSDLFKNASSFRVFNGQDQTGYFHGTRRNVIFLSRAPLFSPYRGVHFIELAFDKRQLLYREKEFRQPEQQKPTTFRELRDVPFFVLLDDVDRVDFQFFTLDKGVGDMMWKKAVNSFEKDDPPDDLLLSLTFQGKLYTFTFPKIITDKNMEVPPDLLQ